MKVKNLSDIPKSYNPNEVEDKWYKYWEDHKLYHSEIDESKESYTVVIPPPNVTGMLTLVTKECSALTHAGFRGWITLQLQPKPRLLIS